MGSIWLVEAILRLESMLFAESFAGPLHKIAEFLIGK